jgi:monovalent cation:H+ antiporter-2, CPA2 family
LATESVIRNARALNPAIHVIVRAPGTGDVSGLSARGADEVVQPEFEAGLEFVRQVLGWQGIDSFQTDDLVSARRQTVYGTKELDALESR